MRSAAWLAVAALMLLFTGLSLWEMAGDSLTSDERVHLPAGYAYWKTRDFRLNPEHPPLMKLLCAAPLLAMNLRLPPTLPQKGEEFHAYQAAFGSRFLFDQDAEAILFRGRLPAIGVGLLLLALLFAWSRDLHASAGAGLTTLGLAALEPTLLSHSHLVADDVALAAFCVMTYYCLWRFGRSGSLRDLALAAAGIGLALASKFSALFQVPIALALVFTGWPAGGLSLGARRFAWRGAGARLLAAGGIMAVAMLFVWAAYLFSPDPGLYLRGLEALRANRPAFNPAYVHGAFYDPAPFWYPLYVFALKTPLPTLCAMLLGLWWTLRGNQKGGKGGDAIAYVLLPAAVHAAAICGLAYNYGQRYMLPLTALLLVPAGRCVDLARGGPASRACGALLVAALGLSIARAAPNQMAYVNELAGGPRNGPRFLSDSNIDWGQDLKRLARFQKERGVPEITLAYWGPGQPEYYGIRWRPWTFVAAASDPPPPGVYAISVNRLVELKRRVALTSDDPRLDWLERFEPSARAGGSILIYAFGEEATRSGLPQSRPARRPGR